MNQILKRIYLSLTDSCFSTRKLKLNKNIEIRYKKINNKLKSITKKNLQNIFSIKEIIKEDGIKLVEIIMKENKNFFEKIGFVYSLKIMMEFIEKYDKKKE